MNISFKESIMLCGMPVIHTDDGRLCFLIDTGASYNVLLRGAYDRERSTFGAKGASDYLIGMEGQPRSIFIVEGVLPIAGADRRLNFGVLDESQAMDTLRIITGQQIDGALGVEFLKAYGLAVDFASMTLHSQLQPAAGAQPAAGMPESLPA